MPKKTAKKDQIISEERLENNEQRYTYSFDTFLPCGDYYKRSPKMLFVCSRYSLVDKLEFIMKSLGVKHERVNRVKLRITGNTTMIQMMMFKLCRYVRVPYTISILNKTIELIESGIPAYTALLFAHWEEFSGKNYKTLGYKENQEYGAQNYSTSMDIIQKSYPYATFDKLSRLANRAITVSYVNSIFPCDYSSKYRNTTLPKIKSLVLQGKYKEAEEIIPKLKSDINV